MRVRLEGLRSVEETAEEVVRCANVYALARNLEIERLHDLAFRKLKALEPFSPAAVLFVVDGIFESVQPDVRQWLIQYLAEHFWELVYAEAAKIAEIMQGDEALAQAVFRRMGGVATPESSVISEERIGAEAKEEIKTEEKENEFLAGGPQETARVPESLSQRATQTTTEGQEAVSKEQMDQEMVRMALE